jgi:hypothetical protein
MAVSLNQQIEEVELELDYRRKVYRRQIARGLMKASIAEFRMDRMRAVLDTLMRLKAKEQA